MTKQQYALLEARRYVRQGLAEYEGATCKWQAKVALHMGDLERAIYLTMVALYIHRLIKQGATT